MFFSVLKQLQTSVFYLQEKLSQTHLERRGRDLWPSLRLQGPAEAGFGLGIPKNVVEDPWSIKIGRHLPVLAS